MQDALNQQKNAIKASELAKTLYPHEKWEVLEAGIFIAKSRMPRSTEQINVLEKELRRARILNIINLREKRLNKTSRKDAKTRRTARYYLTLRLLLCFFLFL
jgi:hypothetical protein